jgi:6-phosphogluconolactonase
VIRIHETAELAAHAAAERLLAAAALALKERGIARLAVSGGRTPEPLFRLLSSSAVAETLSWPQVEILFTDERAVPADHLESNYRLVNDTLVSKLPAPGPRVHRMPADSPDPEAAAREYARYFETPADVILLGMGADGHTASLFPGSPLIGDEVRRVAVVEDSPKPPARRMTIMPRVIQEAGLVLMLVTGDEKSRAVARALEEEGGATDCPARLALGGVWFLDRAAAAAIHRLA